MTRFAVALGLLALVGWPQPAAGQTRIRPAIELGVDASSGPDGSIGWSSVGPRLSANVTNRTALEVSFLPERDRGSFSHVDHVLIHVKRTLLSRDRVSLFGALGVSQATRYYDDTDVQTAFPTLYEPDRSWGPTFGFGAEVPIAPYLRARAEVQYVMSQEALLRFSAGFTVPLGRYPGAPSVDERLALAGTPAASVSIGQTVWVTRADGRPLQGEVLARSVDGLTLSHAGGMTVVAASEIRRIDATDHLLNGVIVGAGVGGAAGGAFGILLSRVICEDTDACVLLGTVLIGSLGAGIGTLAGAMVDSFRDAPRPVYERPSPTGATLRLAPVVARDRLAAAGVIRW